MTSAFSHRVKAVLALGGAVIALSLSFLITSPSGAQASWSAFCTHTLGSHAVCAGAPRGFNAESAYGEDHSVCVFNYYDAPMCSSGPWATVYNPMFEGFYYYLEPEVSNNAAGTNAVHASAWV